MYIHERKEWPNFTWSDEELLPILSKVRFNQGRLLGQMEGLGFKLKAEASLQTLTDDVLKSSEIEGEKLPVDQVRSSIARRLGLDIAGMVQADRHVEGVAEMMVDATQKFDQPLTAERIFGWHAALFPTGRSGMHKITVGDWRKAEDDPMQVLSGPMGKERVHFEAPGGARLKIEMKKFLSWFNQVDNTDLLIKSAVAHLWFVTIHPMDDGNGRIARALADMQLSRSDQSSQRFYSMSSQIRIQRKEYYECLEKTQRGNLDITSWLVWFLKCLQRAISSADEKLAGILNKSKFWEKNCNAILNQRQTMIINKLMDGFEGKLNSSKWSKMAKCSPDTALRDIQGLINQGILQKESGGGRSTSYRLMM